MAPHVAGPRLVFPRASSQWPPKACRCSAACQINAVARRAVYCGLLSSRSGATVVSSMAREAASPAFLVGSQRRLERRLSRRWTLGQQRTHRCACQRARWVNAKIPRDRRHPCCVRASVFLQCLISPATTAAMMKCLRIAGVYRSARTDRLECVVEDAIEEIGGMRRGSKRGSLNQRAAAHCMSPLQPTQPALEEGLSASPGPAHTNPQKGPVRHAGYEKTARSTPKATLDA
ncbi:hypothetical protein K505DRAFT_391835 [Melanomma pulvis-pyrius CBS 109.77]|uniref:Uncharacterized protein n=1 Tax=Melanomma pulvis-pyrius CBS 109.77 TaxID=1314802 RepID=A0A6A6XR76_9PLEO|nr:hypothetical protein K505DRAFT_391835 [Melanomma pulvis-pyrius CBS 109.77]